MDRRKNLGYLSHTPSSDHADEGSDQNVDDKCDFQQCGILTSVDSDKPVQPPFKLRNSQ